MERIQIILGNVMIAGIKCDHICLLNCDELEEVEEGDRVSILGYLKQYRTKKDGTKYGLRFPYMTVRIEKRSGLS